MNQSEEEFIHIVQDDYSGHVKVEMLFDISEGKGGQSSEGHRAMSIRLLLGKSEIIGSKPEYPVELPAFGIYNPERDGTMSEDAAIGFMLRSALGRVYPGASVLLKVPALWPPKNSLR